MLYAAAQWPMLFSAWLANMRRYCGVATVRRPCILQTKPMFAIHTHKKSPDLSRYIGSCHINIINVSQDGSLAIDVVFLHTWPINIYQHCI